MANFEPEPQPPVFNDTLSNDVAGASGGVPPHTTTSGTEAAQAAGVDVGTGPEENTVDPDMRTDLEGPDQLPEDDGTLTHPSLGAGVGLNLGMGTGAGSDDEGADTQESILSDAAPNLTGESR